jgi:hypothetical protein
VLDHRLNCRTVYMNRLNRFLYWNMNYHVEHHMFPLVPYHALPKLHEAVKADMPQPYPGLIAAWRELFPAVLRQVRDPGYFVKRKLPTPTLRREAAAGNAAFTAAAPADADGWIEVCSADKLGREDVIRFDHARRTYALYQTAEGRYHATDGVCTHGNTHLADGLVKGNLIECPQAQRALRHHRRLAPAPARLRQPAHLAAGKPRGTPFPQHRPPGRQGAGAEDPHLPRGVQPQRRHLHQGTGADPAGAV